MGPRLLGHRRGPGRRGLAPWSLGLVLWVVVLLRAGLGWAQTAQTAPLAPSTSASATPTPTPTPSATSSVASASDIPALQASTTVLHVAGEPVRWDELRFWLQQAARQWGRLHESDPALAEPDRATYLNLAIEQARQLRALERQVQAEDIRLTPQEVAHIELRRREDIRIYSGSEYRRIVTRMYGSPEMFDRLSRADRLGQKLFARLWGEHGERCDDAQVARFAQERGLVRVKYLYQGWATAKPPEELAAQALPRDDSAAPRGPLPREHPSQLEVMAQIHALQDRMAHAVDADQADRLFDQAIRTRGEDDAMALDADGRVLPPDRLPPALREALALLQLDAPPRLILAPDGAFLAQRLPVRPDVVVGGHSLRYWAAYQGHFRAQVAQWAQALPVSREAALDLVSMPPSPSKRLPPPTPQP